MEGEFENLGSNAQRQRSWKGFHQSSLGWEDTVLVFGATEVTRIWCGQHPRVKRGTEIWAAKAYVWKIINAFNDAFIIKSKLTL